MNPPLLRRLAPLLVAAALAACSADPSPSASAEPAEEVTPTEQPTPSPTATPEPTDEATPSLEPSASADAAPGGGFAIGAHAEADSLFLSRDDCENLEDGYRLQFPDEWATNEETGSLPPCSWFAAAPFSVDDPTDVPGEVAITIESVESAEVTPDSAISEDEVTVGGTQTATRVEFDDGGETSLEYRVQLGPPGEGPFLLARTDTEMAGDYELNKAVLDRIMATIEFVGTVQ